MNNWLFFALFAPATYAVVNFIDKYLIESKVKDYRGMPLYSAIAGFVFGSVIWGIYGFPTLPWFEAIIVIITGILSVTAATLYFKALAQEETSIIIILFQISPIFSLILSFLILGEQISATQMTGFGLILVAAVGASIKSTRKTFSLSPAFWLIMTTNFMWACSNILFKFVSGNHNFSSLLVYEGWGFGVGGILICIFYPPAKKAFVENVRQVGKTVMSVIFINEAIFVVARLLTYFALTLASVALVVVIGSTQVFFGLVYGMILTLFFPKIFKEKTNPKNLFKKMAFGSLAILGIYLVQ